MWYAYALESQRNGRFYIGSTDDLRRRVIEHNTGIGGGFTKKNRPYRVVFYEAYIEKEDALRAEKFFKSGHGREVLKKEKLKTFFDKRLRAAPAGSSNGRTTDSESVYPGSNPGPAGASRKR